MTHDEMVKVIQAHARGETVQFRITGSDYRWSDINRPSFDFNRFEYRAKPKPKTVTLVLNKDQADTLACILHRVGGSPEHSPRKFAGEVNEMLTLGMCCPLRFRDAVRSDLNAIYFKDNSL